MKNLLSIIAIVIAITSCNGQTKTSTSATFKIHKTDAEWKKELTPKQYEILRKKGTERPFSGQYVKTFAKGKYVCAGCGNLLFLSDSKFQSDCGWPSFDKAIKGSVTYATDLSFGAKRTEVMCANCGGHLGHVFDDGPKETTGQRFCTNSVSVKFIPEK